MDTHVTWNTLWHDTVRVLRCTFRSWSNFKVIWVSVIAIVAVGLNGDSRCNPFSANAADADKAAKAWVQLPPYPEAWTKGTDRTFWREVTGEKRDSAVALLASNSFIPLSEPQATAFTNGFRPASRELKPYLLRAVGPFGSDRGLMVYTRPGQVWVAGAVLSHCDVARERRPVVVWLSDTPRQTFVTFSVAE